MNRERNPWLSGIIALAATLLILFGGQAVYHTFAVAKPLDKAFDGIEGVQSVTWDRPKDDSAVRLRVTLDKTANLQATYNSIEDKAKSVLGDTPLKITISDSRTPALEQAYHAMHFYIQEAIATGRFSDMAESVAEQAAQSGVAALLYVDAEHVYLQLSKDNAELYSVVPRAIAQEVK